MEGVETYTALTAAGERGHMPGRLAQLYGLAGEALALCEAALPRFCDGGPIGAGEAARHLLAAGGKRVRPLLLCLAARACQPEGVALPSERLVPLMTAAELTHAATLLHDDVLDDAEVRRGQEAARVRWGNSVSVLAGDFLLIQALKEIERAGVPGTLPAMIDTIGQMIDAEALQLSLRGKAGAGADAYQRIVAGKTASLFAFCGQAGALCAGAPGLAPALAEYARRLGQAFQIVDDVLDIEGSEAALGKAVMADLREGKLTLPVLLALEHEPGLRGEVESAFAGDADVLPDHLLDQLRRALAACEAPRRARAVAVAEAEAGCAALGPLPPGSCRDALWLVAQELVQRSR